MGPVLKVALEFHTAFWRELEKGRFRNAGFFQAADCQVRTVWTRVPDRSPVLMGWSGGGAALRLIERGVDPVQAALATVAALFPSVDLAAELRNAYFHDWQADPFALGAYSYLRVGGADARERLPIRSPTRCSLPVKQLRATTPERSPVRSTAVIRRRIAVAK